MKYLVTGGAGFIGSNISETLLNQGEEVVVLDNLSSGKRENMAAFTGHPGFTFIEGSITDPEMCARACKGVDYILHHAALVSVPGSIESPLSAHEINATGTLNIFLAGREAGVRRIVLASSSAVYGNTRILPCPEALPFETLSPYAATKAAGELYGRVFSEVYDIPVISLRYFNVFGKRQDPMSRYAAVIPIFITNLLKGERPVIYGDGEQTRDFVYVDNVVQANIRAATIAGTESAGRAYNIGCGASISVNELFKIISAELGTSIRPQYKPLRPGEVRDSCADITSAREAFGYDPAIGVREGLKRTLKWYMNGIVNQS